MRVEFDRDTCLGTYNCVAEWDKFTKDLDAGKALLVESEEIKPQLFARNIPDGEEENAKMAGRVCPVEAITIYDEDGTQLIP